MQPNHIVAKNLTAVAGGEDHGEHDVADGDLVLNRISSTVISKITQPIAWTPEALMNAGLPAEQVRLWLVDEHRAGPERARLYLNGRRRSEPTLRYVWGPDLRFLLGLDGRDA